MGSNSFNVEDYNFQTFSDGVMSGEDASEVTTFKFPEITGEIKSRVKRDPNVLRVERSSAKKNDFKVEPYVLHFRGLQKQEEEEFEARINDEVERRIQKIKDEAFRSGYEEGVEQGKNDVYNQTRAAVEEKLASLSAMISDVLANREEIFTVQRKQIFEMIRNLSRWIILRELSDDGKYVERLLEKLIVELQAKANILVQVNEKDFESMPDVIETIQKKLGELSNVRVEVDYDMVGPGVIVSSENGIINGSLEEQMSNLDRLFESVGVYGEG